LLAKPDPQADAFGTGVRLAAPAQDLAWVAEIRKAQVAAPVAGGTLAWAGRTYPVRRVDLADDELSWVLALGKPV
ncbi:MAG: hypothetical protein AB7P02_13260, partial [Alphaproteobacteria bacterium]